MSRAWYFNFFFVSGFCSLVYEVVWLRLAMASFGVTTPLVSIVLSVFMAGLALGSWGAGRVSARPMHGGTLLRLYATAELVIAVSAVLVPVSFTWGRSVLSAGTVGAAWNSLAYYAVSGAWVGAALLPACVAMGATFPFAMAAMQRQRGADPRAFSFLYTANILGATVGVLASAFVMIELLGFRRAALVTSALNVALAIAALLLARRPTRETTPTLPSLVTAAGPAAANPRIALVALFLTGMLSLGFEVIWIRQLAPYLGPVVYTFATVLAIYLAASFAGARAYRAWPRGTSRAAAWGWAVAAFVALLPLVATDVRLLLPGAVRAIIAIAPVCAVIGYLTPMLIDRFTGGDPARAGVAYALNVLGSIAGPLVAGFWLLPSFGERGALVVLAVPLFALAILAVAKPTLVGAGDVITRRGTAVVVAFALLIGGAVVIVTTEGFGTAIPGALVRRDHTATVIATESNGYKLLLVNGHPTTVLTPITKMMAHLPLAMHESRPRDTLVICFGMGTTFRSALTWGGNVTVVELVPSVPQMFGFYHPDTAKILASPRGRIVIDDGRRFLERSTQTWDVITLDPPYPVEMAGSGLLYAREFYAVARRRLRPDGVMQQWLPNTEPAVQSAAAKAIAESFPHVRVFAPGRVQNQFLGFFFVARQVPIASHPPTALAERLPTEAAADLIEWVPWEAPVDHFNVVLAHEVPIASVIALAPAAPTLADDRPVNEYFFVRRLLE
jgi:spermidine synthase